MLPNSMINPTTIMVIPRIGSNSSMSVTPVDQPYVRILSRARHRRRCPKTRSGKIMRRLLRDVAEGRALGDTTTLADPAVVEMLKEQYGDED